MGGGEDGGGRENKRTSGKGPELARQPLFWLGRLWKIVPIPAGVGGGAPTALSRGRPREAPGPDDLAPLGPAGPGNTRYLSPSRTL